ncbi:MAG: tetratricopeptide repeat protein, partial [Pseudomonadota bacterium]
RDAGRRRPVAGADPGRAGASGRCSFLGDLAEAGDGNDQARVAILRTHLARDEAGAARAYVDGLLAAEPENRLFRYLDAALMDHAGDHRAAAEIYRTLLAEDDGSARIWLELVRSLIRAEDMAAAETAIAEALGVHPRAGTLLWARASLRERAGDMAGAIEIYRTLYEDNAGSLIVANNLASLLT